MNISNTIRKLRTQSKKSQQEMADLLEIERKTYINWENGANDIKSEYIPKLAEIFNVEIQELFRDTTKNITITQNHNEGKDISVFIGAVIILTDKQSVDALVETLKSQMNKE